jgi:hypothetical protein
VFPSHQELASQGTEPNRRWRFSYFLPLEWVPLNCWQYVQGIGMANASMRAVTFDVVTARYCPSPRPKSRLLCPSKSPPNRADRFRSCPTGNSRRLL